MLTATEIARYFLAHSEPGDDLISNLKLQKLLYYAQGVHLAAFGGPLFCDALLAWQHGPVVSKVYHEYKEYDSSPIPPPDDLDESAFDDRTRQLLNFVYGEYGQYSAWKLRNMTHDERPWIEAWESGCRIRHDTMFSFFGPKFGGLLGIGQPVRRTDDAVAVLKSLLATPVSKADPSKRIPLVTLA